LVTQEVLVEKSAGANDECARLQLETLRAARVDPAREELKRLRAAVLAQEEKLRVLTCTLNLAVDQLKAARGEISAVHAFALQVTRRLSRQSQELKVLRQMQRRLNEEASGALHEANRLTRTAGVLPQKIILALRQGLALCCELTRT
jgi:chromosome segregation ATPase